MIIYFEKESNVGSKLAILENIFGQVIELLMKT